MTDSAPDTRASLIARICDLSDHDAWTEFVAIYQPVVERFVQRYHLQSADAAEISQEVLARVAKSIHSFDGQRQSSSFRGWLYRITRNMAIDFLRKTRNELARVSNQDNNFEQFADPASSASADFQAEYEKQLFHWAVERLKPQFKPTNWQAFWLSTIEGLSIETVATQLGIECSTVYIARSRIMARLAQLVQERLNEINQEHDDQVES